ncbi:hypothetical protein SprV_0702406800 [Sparganum proliferum]
MSASDRGPAVCLSIPGYQLRSYPDVFNRWNADLSSDRHQLEKTFQITFRRAYDRLQKRTNKLSTSRQLDETADDDENTPRPGPSGSSSQP